MIRKFIYNNTKINFQNKNIIFRNYTNKRRSSLQNININGLVLAKQSVHYWKKVNKNKVVKELRKKTDGCVII